jgi:hypothetical protein
MTDPWSAVGVIETYSGRQFDLFDPVGEAVHLPDVAAGLAHTCRFGGHCRRFYSVAHHSLHVSRELDAHGPRLQLVGLLHDAAEAYVGDVPRPLKTELDGFDRLEAGVLEAVWAGLGLAPPSEAEWQRVMDADDRLLSYEADRLLADGSWAGEPPELGYSLDSTDIEAIRGRFLDRAEALLGRVKV